MSDKCWKCGMPYTTGGCGGNHVVFGPQPWQFGPPIDNEKELMKAEIASLKERLEAAEAELEKYKALWEYSRETDKMQWLHYEWKT